MFANLREIIVSAAFVILLALKFDPLNWLMPTRSQVLVLCLLVAAFGLYAGILFRQKVRDEREALHLHRASRIAYIAGVAVLVAAIVIQSLMGMTDPWLFGVLGGMIIIKMAVLIWSRLRN